MSFFKKIWKFLQTIISILIIVAMIYGMFLLLSNLLSRIKDIDVNIIAAFVASLTAVFGYWYTQRQSKLRDISESHRPKKAKLYNTFMDILERVLRPTIYKDEEEIDPDDLPDDIKDLFFEFNRGLIVWGSPSMIKTWLKFRVETSKPSVGNNPLLLMDDVLRSIREDLGNSNADLKKGDLIKIFLKDPTELDEKLEIN